MSNDSLPKHPVRRTLFDDVRDTAREEGKAAEENLKKIKRGLEELQKILPEPTGDNNQTPSSSPVKKTPRN